MNYNSFDNDGENIIVPREVGDVGNLEPVPLAASDLDRIVKEMTDVDPRICREDSEFYKQYRELQFATNNSIVEISKSNTPKNPFQNIEGKDEHNAIINDDIPGYISNESDNLYFFEQNDEENDIDGHVVGVFNNDFDGNGFVR